MKENWKNTNAISLKHFANPAEIERLGHYKFLLNTPSNYDLLFVEENVLNNGFQNDKKF